MDVDFIRFQFDDGHYGVITKTAFKIGVRHIQMLYMFANSIALGIIRGTLGSAVLAINDQTRANNTYIKIYNWSGNIQGAVLSSFFIGYALMLIPSEKILKNINGKILTTLILLTNGLLCVAMPTIVNKAGWLAVCNAKLIMGMTHGCFHTINHSQLEIWLPPSERKIFNFIIYSGVQMGIVLGLSLAGPISVSRLGWELVYYSLGMVGLSMAVISLTLTASKPENHQAMGDTEKEFIRKNLECYRKKKLDTPWCSILKSWNIWAVICAHVASNTLFVFYLTYVPAFLMTFGKTFKYESMVFTLVLDGTWWNLHLELKHLYCSTYLLLKPNRFRLTAFSKNTWCSMLPFIAMSTVYMVIQPITEYIYKIKYLQYILSASLFRKTVNALGAFGIIIGLSTLPDITQEYNGQITWPLYSIALLTAILGLLGFQFCGFLSSFRDMSENYAGSVMIVSATISSIFSGIMNFLFGVILGDDLANTSRWRVVFLTLASIYIIGNVVYTILGCNKRQYWDRAKDRKFFGHLNISVDVNQEQINESGFETYVSCTNEIDTPL